MIDQLSAPKPHESEHAEFDRIAQRLDVVVDILGFKESNEAVEARGDLVARVDQDGLFDDTNAEHRALLGAYQVAAEESYTGLEPEPVVGYQLALMGLWLRLDDPDRFYERLDDAREMLYQSRLDAAIVEVNAIVDDLASLNQQ